jgi:hypothetical protein
MFSLNGGYSRSGPGEALKDVFENLYLEEFGSDVIIYQNWNSPNMTSSSLYHFFQNLPQ